MNVKNEPLDKYVYLCMVCIDGFSEKKREDGPQKKTSSWLLQDSQMKSGPRHSFKDIDMGQKWDVNQKQHQQQDQELLGYKPQQKISASSCLNLAASPLFGCSFNSEAL